MDLYYNHHSTFPTSERLQSKEILKHFSSYSAEYHAALDATPTQPSETSLIRTEEAPTQRPIRTNADDIKWSKKRNQEEAELDSTSHQQSLPPITTRIEKIIKERLHKKQKTTEYLCQHAGEVKPRWLPLKDLVFDMEKLVEFLYKIKVKAKSF